MTQRRDFSVCRSSHYQATILESPCAPDLLFEFCELQSIGGMLNLDRGEQLKDLQEQLRKEFWRVVDTKLTKRQAEVLHLLADGKTQVEVAKLLCINQSSITKSWNGNSDYRNGNRKSYGGSKRKLIRLVSEDLVIAAILNKISELQEEIW